MLSHRVRFLVSLACVITCAVVIAACSQPSRLNLRCLAGDLQRCRQLGDMYAQGNGVRQDYPRAASLYERVCDTGVAEVCNTLGEIYDRVGGFESEAKRVPGLFERACTAGSANGCLNWGIIAAEREEYERAAGLFDRACVQGASGGCHRLALAFERGEGVLKDVSRAVALFEQACDAQHAESCVVLAALFTDGIEVERDLARATACNTRLLQVYADGCESGVQRDCVERDRLRTRLALTGVGTGPGRN